MSDTLIDAKVVLLGDTGVGKTCVVVQFVEQKFSPHTPLTIGASFLTKTLCLEGSKIRLQLWDTAGQERFRSLAPMYYRGAEVALLVYDVASEDSFVRVKEWVKELRTNIFEEITLVLVGNQIDKLYREVPTMEAGEYAHSIHALFFEVSAKNNTGIDEMFLEIAKRILQRHNPSDFYSKNLSLTLPPPIVQSVDKPCCS